MTEAKRFVALCREQGALSIINDSAEIAAQAGADGIHVGQGDLEASHARALLGARQADRRLRPHGGGGLAGSGGWRRLSGRGRRLCHRHQGRCLPISRETIRAITAAVNIPWWPSAASAKITFCSSRVVGWMAWRWYPPSSHSRMCRPRPESSSGFQRRWSGNRSHGNSGLRAVFRRQIGGTHLLSPNKNCAVFWKGVKTMKTALTIAGTDPSGGAGIQADIKTMTAHGYLPPVRSQLLWPRTPPA